MELNVPEYKELLTIRETASIYGLGLHTIRRITNAENCPFVLWNGNKRLIKRRLFEEFLFSQRKI